MKRKLSVILALVVLLALPLAVTACWEDDEQFDLTDSAFTSFTAEDYDGKVINQSALADYKVTMINIWGSFCVPCKTEVPALAELNAELHDKGFQVIGIPIDANYNSAADARQMIAELCADFRQLKVSNSLRSFVTSAKAVPYTIFVNAEGKQIGPSYSGAKSKTEWKTLIEKMLQFVDSNAG